MNREFLFPLASHKAGASVIGAFRQEARPRPPAWSLTWSSLPWVPHPPRAQSRGPCCWSARPWGLMECLGHGVWLLGVGVRLHEVCFDLVGIAVQTLGIFSEGCSLELVLSFLPLLVSSVASPCAAATSTRRWPLIAGFVLSARTCMIQST